MLKFYQDIEEIKKILSMKTGHSIDMALRQLSSLQEDLRKEEKRREEFEKEILKKV